MGQLDTLQYIPKGSTITPQDILICPECKNRFTLAYGKTYPTYFVNMQGQQCHGLVTFCSTSCILSWVNIAECARC